MISNHYDVVISGGHVIDPAQGIDGPRDVAISGDRIAAVAEHLPPHTAGRVIDATGRLVTPGLIDMHAHLYWGRDYFGIDADSIAWRCGVTTWVDPGSVGAFSLPGLREHIARRSAVRMFAFINMSYVGIPGLNYDEYCNPLALDIPLLARAVELNRDFVVGIKVRLGKEGVCSPGLRPLHVAIEASEVTGLPIMCHISDAPPAVAGHPEIAAAGRHRHPRLHRRQHAADRQARAGAPRRPRGAGARASASTSVTAPARSPSPRPKRWPGTASGPTPSPPTCTRSAWSAPIWSRTRR